MALTLFLADPLSKLKNSTDSSLAILRASGEEPCFWAESCHLSWRKNEVQVWARPVFEKGADDTPVQLGPPEWKALRDFARVFVRKEPPFDSDYLQMLWWLCPYEDRLYFLNQPSALLRYHEKIIPLLMKIEGVLETEEIFETLIFSEAERAKEALRETGWTDIVVKPLLGFGGREIQRTTPEDFNKNGARLFEKAESFLFQSFEERIFSEGDRRALYLFGEMRGDFVRLPAEGEFVSNLSRGGRVVERPWSAKERAISEKLSAWLKAKNIAFAGADFVADRLSEVNITCPTGLVQAEALGFSGLASDLWKSTG